MNAVSFLVSTKAADLADRPPLVDLIGIGAPAGAAAHLAVIKAGGAAITHELRRGDRRSPRLSGALAIVDAGQDDAALHILLSDIREGTDIGIVLILPDVSPESRLMARLHGADHIVAADIDERELAAIVRNELRYRSRLASRPRAGEDQNRWHLDGERWSLIAPNQREARLTHSEFRLLQLLIGRPGHVQQRDSLRAAIDGDPSHGRVLDTVISRLRRKVWDCTRMELPLRSARGEGYVFAANGQA